MTISRLAFIAALAAPSLVFAAPAADKPKLADGDVAVVAHEHAVNQMEITMGKLADKNGSPDVKAYGDMLVKDHTQADKDLTAFAKAHGLKSIPADKPAPDDKKANDTMLAKLRLAKNSKAGKADFDTMFLDAMVDGHKAELAKLDAATTSVADPDLKTWLTSVHPVMQKHEDDATALDSKIKAKS